MGIIVVAVVAIVCGARYSMLSKHAVVPDVTRRWEDDFSNPLGTFLNGNLRIELSGYLDAPAMLYCDYQPIELPAGKIHHFIWVAENWGRHCNLQYDPLTVTSGSLSLRVMLGSCPDFKPRLAIIGDPEPLNLNGGWTFFYPDSKRKYSHGYYQRGGKRNGKWEYFDENGNLIRTEQWRNGVQTR